MSGLLPLAGEHEVARLDVAMDQPLFVGMLEPERRLLDEEARVGDRQLAPGLDHPGQVQALDVLHGEDDALAEPEWRNRR